MDYTSRSSRVGLLHASGNDSYHEKRDASKIDSEDSTPSKVEKVDQTKGYKEDTRDKKDNTEVLEKLTLQIREDMKKIESERAQLDKERNLLLENYTIKLQKSFLESQIAFFKDQSQRDEKLRADLQSFVALSKAEPHPIVTERLSSIEASIRVALQKLGDLDARVRSIEERLGGFLENGANSFQQYQDKPSSSSYQSTQQISNSNNTSSNSSAPQSSSWFGSKTYNIYVWRLDSTKSTFPRFSDCLKEYIDSTEKKAWLSRGTKLGVVDINGLDAITTEGTVLICGYTAGVRIEAEPIIDRRKLIEQNAKVSCKVHYVVFRFGDKSLPAKVSDESNQEVAIPCLNIFFDSKGFITNDYTSNSLKKITTV